MIFFKTILLNCFLLLSKHLYTTSVSSTCNNVKSVNEASKKNWSGNIIEKKRKKKQAVFHLLKQLSDCILITKSKLVQHFPRIWLAWSSLKTRNISLLLSKFHRRANNRKFHLCILMKRMPLVYQNKTQIRRKRDQSHVFWWKPADCISSTADTDLFHRFKVRNHGNIFF